MNEKKKVEEKDVYLESESGKDSIRPHSHEQFTFYSCEAGGGGK